MNTCPLLFIANRSFKKDNKKILFESSCHGRECSWFDERKNKCKLIQEPYKLNYIEKTLKCI